MSNDNPSAAESAPKAPTPAQPVVELVTAPAVYVNFARVSGSPEELILDCGLNPQPYAANPEPIRISQRLVMNYYTAKRLLLALNMSVQRHEQALGTLELDVNKRVNTASASKAHAGD